MDVVFNLTLFFLAVDGYKRGCPFDNGIRIFFRLLVFVDRCGNLAQEGQLHGHGIAGELCGYLVRLPFGRLWYSESNAVSNAIDYAKFRVPLTRCRDSSLR